MKAHTAFISLCRTTVEQRLYIYIYIYMHARTKQFIFKPTRFNMAVLRKIHIQLQLTKDRKM